MSAQWFQVYEAHFGKKLSEAEIDVWEEEIAREIRHLGAGDLVAAIRRMAEERRREGSRGKYAPTVDAVITEIIRGKYISNNPAAGEPVHTVLVPDLDAGPGHWMYIRQTESEWKSRLHHADADEAWSIICEPCHPDQCRERETYCIDRGIGYKRFIPHKTHQEIRAYAERVRAASGTLDGVVGSSEVPK